MILLPPRSTLDRSSAASDVYKRQELFDMVQGKDPHPSIKQTPIFTDEKTKQFDRNRVCLLYTSPSPRDRTRPRLPPSACKKKSIP